MNWITFIVSAAMGQGILLTILLVTKNADRKQPRILLALLMGSFSISLFHLFPYWQMDLHNTPIPLRLGEPFQYLFGPLIYLYIQSMISRDFGKKGLRLFHFLPFLAALILLYLFKGFGQKDPHPLQLFSILSGGFLILQLLIYSVVIHGVLNKCMEQLKKGYSSLDKVNLQWLFVIMMALLLITLLDVLLFSHLLHNTFMHWMDIGVPLLLSLILFVLGYKGLSQPDIFYALARETGSRYEKSGLSEEKRREIQMRLGETMEKDEPYLQPGLTLGELAEQSGISRNHLSQVLNENLHVSFHDFINAARVSAVIKALDARKQKNQTLLAIALDAGFSSKATFNVSFKKHTGLTPSQYMKKVDLPKETKA